MKKIVIFGSGGHSKVIIDIIEKSAKYEIIGMIDSQKPVGTKVFDYEVVGGIDYVVENKESIFGGVVAIGDNWRRSQTVDQIKSIIPEFHFIVATHPSAFIGKNVMIDCGTVVMAGAIINPNTTIGEHCIINTNSSVDHDCSIGNFATVAPGVTIAGTVTIGDHSVISIGASVIHNITIGEHTVIGAGSSVLKNVRPYTVNYGTPAKEIRKRNEGDKYL